MERTDMDQHGAVSRLGGPRVLVRRLRPGFWGQGTTRWLVAALLLLLASTSARAASTEDWAASRGVYARADGDQYNCGRLQLLPLESGCVLFEFDVMSGSEDEGESLDFRLSGTMLVEGDGSATWEGETGGGAVCLNLGLQGRTVKVTQKGDLPVSVAGTYAWSDAGLEATAGLAQELLEGLPTAATSLNSNNGAYRLEMASEETDDWFYDVRALFRDSGGLLAEFLVASDLSAVYRVDVEAPVLLHGSADSMMAAVRTVVPADGLQEGTGACAARPAVAGVAPSSVPLVDAIPSNSKLRVGATARVTAVTPGRIPATIQCTSDRPGVAAVDAAGVITGMAPGSAVISGMIAVDGSQKAFSFPVEVLADTR